LLPYSKFQIYIESLGNLNQQQINKYVSKIGKLVSPDQLHDIIDFAFLALHGPYGEDGNIQGLLEWYKIPYSGSGVLGCALGINKIIQKKWMQQAGHLIAPYKIINKCDWQKTIDKSIVFEHAISDLGLPLVIKSPCQGSSIGVS